MITLLKREFTNKNNDHVTLTLMEDSFGGYHLIIKSQLLRRFKEQRVANMQLIELETSTFTDETSHTQIPNKRSAEVEYNMQRALKSDPDWTMNMFQSWLSATTPSNEK